jgi:hypothetical protein
MPQQLSADARQYAGRPMREKLDAAVAAKCAGGMPRQRAVSAVIAENPSLHAAVIAEANGKHTESAASPAVQSLPTPRVKPNGSESTADFLAMELGR